MAEGRRRLKERWKNLCWAWNGSEMMMMIKRKEDISDLRKKYEKTDAMCVYVSV